MSDQLNGIEEMVTSLIKMQATNNAKLEELSEELKETNRELKGVKDTLHNFQAETNLNFRKLSRHIKLIENDLDETMHLVESREHS